MAGTEIINFAVYCFYEGNFPYSTDILKQKVTQNTWYSLSCFFPVFFFFLIFFDTEIFLLCLGNSKDVA